MDTSIRNTTLPGDETINVIVQEGVKQKDLHEATVTLLDGRRLSVQVHVSNLLKREIVKCTFEEKNSKKEIVVVVQYFFIISI